MPAYTNTYVIGRGKLYFDPWDGSNLPTGERYLGNCPGFEVTIDSETLEHFSSESGVAEKDDQVTLSVVRNATITCDNITAENLALFMVGTASTLSQTSATVANEAFTVTTARYYQLGVDTSTYISGKQGISAVTVSDTTGTTTYTVDVDYELDTTQGRVYIIDGGAITTGDTIHVDYTYATNSRDHITSASLTSTTGAIRFIADNPKGTNNDLFAPKVELRPSGSFQWIGDEWLQLSFEVEFLKRDTNTQQVYIDGVAS